MSQLKWYNPGTATWEPMLIGAQGPVGPTGQAGPTGPTPTDYVSSFNGVTGAITGVNSVNGSTGTITGIATTAGNLSQFGATTSAQLAGVLSDETGTGPNVFATGPTISQPVIDNAKLGYTTTVTSATTVTLTANSNYQQYFTGSTAQTITLPVASTMTLGQSFKIVNNNTANSLTVNSSGGNAVITVPIGFNAEVVCILTSGTTAASWSGSFCDFDTTTGTGSVVLSAAPTFTGAPLSTTATVDTNTTQIATTAFVLAQASATNPLVNGTVAVGTSTRYSRQDHVHPIDTTRAPLASPTFTGIATAPTAVVTTTFVRPQVAPTAGTAAGATTLTAAQLATNIITWTQTAAVTLTLPSASSLDTQLGTAAVTDTAFEWSVINLGTTSGAVTMAAGTSHTYVGSTTVAIGTTARFATRRSAATPTYITYRIA